MACFVPGCTTKQKRGSNKRSDIALFKPTSDEVLKSWQKAIPGSRLLQKNRAVCQLHFNKDQVITHFQHSMPDGSVLEIKRDRPLLKKGSIPSIFPTTGKENKSNNKHYLEQPFTNVLQMIRTGSGSDVSTVLQSDLNNVQSTLKTAQNIANCLKDCNRMETLQPTTHVTITRDTIQSTEGMQNIVPSQTIPEDVQDYHVSQNVQIAISTPISMIMETQNADDLSCAQSAKVADTSSEFLKICKTLEENPQSMLIPTTWITQVIVTGLPCIMWTEWKEKYSGISKRIVLLSNMTVQIYINEALVDIEDTTEVQNIEDMKKLILFVSNYVFPCQTINDVDKSKKCTGYVLKKESSPGPRKKSCLECKNMQYNLSRRIILKKQTLNYTKNSRNLKRKSKRLRNRISVLKKQIKDIKDKCAKSNDEAIRKACENLPDSQKFAVEACFNASKIIDTRGIRYTNQWIYEFLLLRIKSRKTYNHLRSHAILALPCLETLNRYLKSIKGTYGFDNNIFKILRKKTEEMDPSDVRGILLVDEMKLSKNLSFNKKNLQMEGFINLGKYTPHNQKYEKGDHALVVMFQPFKGKWVQTLGCFLSKGSANGTVLHQIIMEAIILSEKAGLKIDAIANDGASWNRSMWDLFGVTEKNVSIKHIVDPQRRLWFFSDFPHLIKCFRNFFSKQNRYHQIWTPDGPVSLKHWYALLAVEKSKDFNLKINYNLREEHINPQYYQKMNVALAFQFFGVADAMELLKNEHPDLKDCEGSMKLCRRVKALITAMNSRTPLNTLRQDNEMWKNIESFLHFLREWETESKKDSNKYEFITDQTCYGLKVSLQGALEICAFLVEECDFEYLMTARLNQDNLERFFGMMRNCCGSNDHPDSALFIQMYKLVSTYSLVKPPKGSNISGGDIIDVLLKIKDIENVDDRQQQWDAQIDMILDKGWHTDVLPHAVKIMEDHDYFECSTSDYVTAYIAGFVARKGTRFARLQINRKKFEICENCIASLHLSEHDEKYVSERYKLIRMRSRGYLCEPSVKLFLLITVLEKATLAVLNKGTVNADTLFQITDAVEDLAPLPLVGCEKHYMKFTHRVVSFYLTTRMFFITKQANKNDSIEKERTREKRKLAKLSYAPNNEESIAIQNHDSVKTRKRKNRKTALSSAPARKRSKKL